MSTIDADVHISPYGPGDVSYGGNNITIDAALRLMDDADVAQAVMWLQPPYLRHVNESNRYLYNAACAHPDRVLPFGWANPRLGMVSAIDEVKRCLDDYGFHGVKFNGAQDDYYIDDEKLTERVMDAVVERRRMLAFHVGADAYEKTHPFRLAKIARRYPDTAIFLIHIGGAGTPDLHRAALEVALDCPNVTLIGSAVEPSVVLEAVRSVGAERVCFGSDAPFRLMHVELASYRALLDRECTPAELAAIYGDNVRRLLAR